MDFSCELPFHREHLTCHENMQFPTNWKLKLQQVYEMRRLFFMLLSGSHCFFSLQSPKLGQVCQVQWDPPPALWGPFRHFVLGPQPFGSNLPTDCDETEEGVSPVQSVWSSDGGTLQSQSLGFAWW